MDPQFKGLASEIADAVEERLSGAFEERIKTHVEEAVDKRLPGNFEERIKTHIDQFEQRAELRMQMHFENLEQQVTSAAEGYGGVLDGIRRELVELNEKVDTKFADHDLVLMDHNKRITELEKPRD